MGEQEAPLSTGNEIKVLHGGKIFELNIGSKTTCSSDQFSLIYKVNGAVLY
jgi:hypothetical protein